MRRRDVLRTAPTALLLGGALPARASDGFTPLGSVAVPGAREAVVGPDDVAYVATVDGFAAVDVAEPTDPTVLADRSGILRDDQRGPLRDIQDVSVDGDRLLLVGPADHAGEDALQAAVVFDVSDPSAPERVAVHGTDFPIHNAELDDGHAYLTGNDREYEPLVILDVAEGEVGRWSIPEYDGRWAAVNPWLRNLHDVRVHDGRAYCSHWDAGTWIVDISDPDEPAYLGRIGGRSRESLLEETAIGRAVAELPGNHHSAAVNEEGTLLAIGREAWSTDPARAPGGIDLWAVLDPARPLRLARIAPPPTDDPSHGGTWTTAHNFELRDARLYAAWYQGGVTVHDVADPRNPVELASWRDGSAARFWTAQRASGHVVASDMGIGDVGGAELMTFPDPVREPPTPRSSPVPPAPPTTTTAGRSPSPSVDKTPTTTPGQSSGRIGASAGEAAVGIGILAALGLAIRRWRR